MLCNLGKNCSVGFRLVIINYWLNSLSIALVASKETAIFLQFNTKSWEWFQSYTHKRSTGCGTEICPKHIKKIVLLTILIKKCSTLIRMFMIWSSLLVCIQHPYYSLSDNGFQHHLLILPSTCVFAASLRRVWWIRTTKVMVKDRVERLSLDVLRYVWVSLYLLGTHNSKHSSNSGLRVLLWTFVCWGQHVGNRRRGTSSTTTNGSLRPWAGTRLMDWILPWKVSGHLSGVSTEDQLLTDTFTMISRLMHVSIYSCRIQLIVYSIL